MDELRARITAQREIRECCVLTFTETWLTGDIPDSAIQLESFAAYRGDRTLASGKHRGGGVCVYVNKRWCTDVQTMEKHCSQDIELLMVKCRPFYLPHKTKEMIIDPRTREKEPHRPLFIGETEVERVKTFKFLGTHISEDLTWSHNTQQILKKSQRRLYFLRRLRKFGMSTTILSCFYRCTIESVLTASITVWYGNCTTRDRKALQRVIKTSQNIVGAALPSLQDIYTSRVLRRTHNLIKDSTHPQHSLFTLLPSGRRYRSLKSRTTRLANSFYPQAIRLLNEALRHATRNTHS
ncbi:uncharacterized protein LOC129191401 [Dunckerocampus dactyliophorus]|uniref:uncharacterized protein LOC129191401 n=1 Tax=Dunckerocampus dactyliophorus TaxID=161453 RepID=UPI002406D8AF|nr:uncharacterized protein LOC129191401 [Dunckerocampus dactyliophorus]